MPTYEYECTKCGHLFEKFQGIKDAPVKTCPKCRCKVRRLVSGGSGVLFKGSGFYATDYRSGEYKKAARKESGEAGGSKGGESSKGESKGPAKPKPE